MSRNTIATMVARLDADTARFQREMQRVGRDTARYNQRARAANDQNARLSNTFRRAANSAAVLQGPLNGISGRLSFIATGLRSVGASGLALGVGVGAAVTVLGSAAAETDRFERSQAVLQAQLRATNNAVGFTRDELVRMADEVGRSTLASEADVRRAQSQLLRFSNVTGEQFERTIRLAQDFATVTEQDIASSARRLGQILEEPAEALSRLRREGIFVSRSQQEVVESFVRTGEVAKAQEQILAMLEQRIGGAGSAENIGVAGASDGLGQSWREMLREIGQTTGVTSVAASGLRLLDDSMQGITTRLRNSSPMRIIDPAEIERQLKEVEAKIAKAEEDRVERRPIENARSAQEAARINAQALEQERLLSDLYSRRFALEVQQQNLEREQREAREQAEAQEAERRRARLEEQARTEEEARARELARAQEHSLNLIRVMDMTYSDEEGKREIAHRNQLEQISQLYADQEALERLGFESLEAMREHYRANEVAAYERQSEALREAEAARIQAESESAQREIQRIMQFSMDEYQILESRHERRIEQLREFLEQKHLTEEEFLEMERDLHVAHNDQLSQLTAAKRSMMLGGYSQLFDGLAGLAEVWRGKQTGIYRGLFAASKAFAVADSAVQIWNGIAKAANNPWPINLAAMASVGAATVGLVSNIQGTQLAGARANGGPVAPGTWLVGERGPELLDLRGGRGQITSNENLRQAIAGGGREEVNLNFNMSALTDDAVVDLIMRNRDTVANAVLSVFEDRGMRVA
ncbi:MAG: phage tail length tape measure family protein [Idiomarina sp.]|nr:phage tail length tape measure family protein [Idiomarina sp.]